MAGKILERVARQKATGQQTMEIVYPEGVNDAYIWLGAGVFDVIITWPGRAAVAVVHNFDGTHTAQHHWVIKENEWHGERRGMVRLASEHQGQRFYLQSKGTALDGNLRASVQVIPVDLSFDFEVTTS